jgi:hypothetical protein
MAATPGHWSRLKGCTYSETCAVCGQSDDSKGAALLRQHAAAGGGPGTEEAPRRVVCTFVSDMKGLMQICGHAGAMSTWNSLLCEARLHQTAKAGVPHLRELPEPWKSSDQRPEHVISPPLRKGTDEMAELARAYAADAAKPDAPKDLSSADYKSCSLEPMIWSDDLNEHISRTPLHITLGLGTNYIHMVKAEALALDTKWAMCVADSDQLDTFIEANGEATEARAEAERQRDIVESKSCGMSICLDHDPKADRKGSAKDTRDDHAWVIKYRVLKKERDAAEAAAKKAEVAVTVAEKKEAAAKAVILGGQLDGGPFTNRYHAWLKEVGISEAVYFGGTFIGPYLEKVFGSQLNTKLLAEIVAVGQFVCPDGEERPFGSDERVAELLSVFTPFGKLHRLFNRKDSLCEHELASFQPLVVQHAVAFAKTFPTTVPTPKMHVLCFHMDELMQRRGSVGIDTEQGIESFHPEFNYVLNMFRNMDRQPEKQLEAVAARLWSRGGGKRARGEEGVKEQKQVRGEKARAKHKKR